MSKLNSIILEDLKDAMKEKKSLNLNVLRMLLSAIKNKKIALSGRDGKELNDEEIIDVVKSEIKKRKDSVVAYRDGGREELALNEEKEIKILEKYMPEQLSEDELRAIIEEVLDSLGDLGPKDFGRAMGAVMAKIGNKADGNIVSKILKEVLA